MAIDGNQLLPKILKLIHRIDNMLAHSIFFYFFSSVAIASTIMVVISKNTVHSVFFLILDFVTIACLFIMIGAEFLGMIMLIVYVGAVAVLFLFVVMMLNVNLPTIKNKFSKYWLIGSFIAAIIFFELIIIIGGSHYNNILILTPKNGAIDISNTELLGNILYTDNIYLFQTAGMILLVAMIGAIVLTYRTREGIKRQSYLKQISRERKDSVELVDVESDKGVNLDE
jgi:NADH-quinone oxidoreductase subunit J